MFIARQMGFLLTRQSRDVADQAQVEYWLATEDGPVRLILAGEQLSFYLPLRDKERALELFRQHHLHGRLRTTTLNTFQQEPVLACCFPTLSAYHRAVSYCICIN